MADLALRKTQGLILANQAGHRMGPWKHETAVSETSTCVCGAQIHVPVIQAENEEPKFSGAAVYGGPWNPCRNSGVAGLPSAYDVLAEIRPDGLRSWLNRTGDMDSECGESLEAEDCTLARYLIDVLDLSDTDYKIRFGLTDSELEGNIDGVEMDTLAVFNEQTQEVYYRIPLGLVHPWTATMNYVMNRDAELADSSYVTVEDALKALDEALSADGHILIVGGGLEGVNLDCSCGHWTLNDMGESETAQEQIASEGRDSTAWAQDILNSHKARARDFAQKRKESWG